MLWLFHLMWLDYSLSYSNNLAINTYTQFTYLFIYYIVTLDENDDLITSFEVALQTIRKVKARVIEFWDSFFPDWRDFKQDDLKIESLKRHNILFGSTRSYCKLCVLSPTGAQLWFWFLLVLCHWNQKGDDLMIENDV